MAEPKTRPTGASVPEFLAAIADEERRRDCQTLNRMMRQASGEPARMWGPSIVGYGSYTMTYADGRTLDWPVLGFSPRVQALTVYLMAGLKPMAALLPRLGKHKRSDRGCLYIRRLADVDLDVLARIVEQNQAIMSRGVPPAPMAGRSRKAAASHSKLRAARAAAPAHRSSGAKKATGKRRIAPARRRTTSRAR